jgi:hypothetical protein
MSVWHLKHQRCGSCIIQLSQKLAAGNSVLRQEEKGFVFDDSVGSIGTARHCKALANDSDGGKSKYSRKNLSHCHFIHHTFHVDWP